MEKKSNFKIIISILVIIIVIVGIVIFINKDNKSEKETTNELKIGETINLYDNEIEFTIDNIEFTNYYYNEYSDLFMTKCEENAKSKQVSQNGKTFIIFSGKIKYIGKENQTYSGLGGFITLDYNNGYTFNPQSIYINQKDNWKNTVRQNKNSTTQIFITFEPLDSTEYICRGYFEVPKEVEINTDAPLKLNIKQKDINSAINIRTENES